MVSKVGSIEQGILIKSGLLWAVVVYQGEVVKLNCLVYGEMVVSEFRGLGEVL